MRHEAADDRDRSCILPRRGKARMRQHWRRLGCVAVGLAIAGCTNNPYPDADAERKILYGAFNDSMAHTATSAAKKPARLSWVSSTPVVWRGLRGVGRSGACQK